MTKTADAKAAPVKQDPTTRQKKRIAEKARKTARRRRNARHG